MAAIGILGGMGPQASAHLQTLLVRDTPKHTTVQSDTDFPEIVLLSVPVPNFVANKEHLKHVKHILIDRTKLLEQAGCSVAGVACNTAHVLLPDIQAATTVPFVSIPELVSAKVDEAGFRRVGLLATPTTLSSTLFDDALENNITLIRPTATMAENVETLIFRQLQGTRTVADKLSLRRIVEQFIDDQRLDAIILGCTELPLVFGETDDVRVIDTLQVLSEGLLREFFNPTVLRRHNQIPAISI